MSSYWYNIDPILSINMLVSDIVTTSAQYFILSFIGFWCLYNIGTISGNDMQILSLMLILGQYWLNIINHQSFDHNIYTILSIKMLAADIVTILARYHTLRHIWPLCWSNIGTISGNMIQIRFWLLIWVQYWFSIRNN